MVLFPSFSAETFVRAVVFFLAVNGTELVLFEVESSILSSIVVVGSCSNEV